MNYESTKKARSKYLSDKKQLRIWLTYPDYLSIVRSAESEGVSISSFVRSRVLSPTEDNKIERGIEK